MNILEKIADEINKEFLPEEGKKWEYANKLSKRIVKIIQECSEIINVEIIKRTVLKDINEQLSINPEETLLSFSEYSINRISDNIYKELKHNFNDSKEVNPTN